MTTVIIEIEYFDENNTAQNIYPQFSGDAHWDNDGIGSYEAWGFKGFDRGRDYIAMEDDAVWDEKYFTERQNEVIRDFYKKNIDMIHGKICEKYAMDRRDD